MRVVIDDEMKRRNMQRVLQRTAISGLAIAVEISLSGRSLVLGGTDLDRMIDRANSGPRIDPALRKIIKDKQSFERRKAALGFLEKCSTRAFEAFVAALIKQTVSN